MIAAGDTSAAGRIGNPPFDWRPHLRLHEVLLWQGRPREGAGWRCLLRELGVLYTILLALILFIGGLCLLALIFAPPATLLAALVTMALVAGGVVRLGMRSLRLRHTRYAVTDTRALIARGWLGPDNLTTLEHDDLAPRATRTICGTTIWLGRPGGTDWTDPTDLSDILAAMFDTDDASRPAFRALEAATVPLTLLDALADGCDPLEALRRTRTGGAP